MHLTSARILVVDDDAALLRFMVELLADAGFVPAGARDAHDAIRQLGTGSWDAVVTDMRLPGMSGLDLLAWMRRWKPTVPSVAITAFAMYDQAELATRAGARRCLAKPFAADDLVGAVAACLGRSAAAAPSVVGGTAMTPERQK